MKNRKPTHKEILEIVSNMKLEKRDINGVVYTLHPTVSEISKELDMRGYSFRNGVVSNLNKRLRRSKVIFSVSGGRYAYIDFNKTIGEIENV